MPSIVSLARFQFAMTTVFHYFFVPLSIGMVLMTAVFEGLYIATKDERYKKHTQFWGKIMLLSFAVGVVTGIIQEFQFGMNWSDYSRFVGDIFGAPLAIEALLAFFLESTFIGLWLFTWDRFKPVVHWIFMLLTLLGSLLSAFWILVANSFMQEPGQPGKIWNLYLHGVAQHATSTAQVQHLLAQGAKPQLVNFGALFANSQVLWQYIHVVTGAFIMGGMAVAGMAAWRAMKKKDVDFYKKAMKVGFVVLLCGSLLSLAAGDRQMNLLVQDKGQPMKAAAMEGAYEDVGKPVGQGTTLADYKNSPDSASMQAVAFFNEKEHKTVFSIDIPYALSILSYHQPTGAFRGMNTVNTQLVKEYGPDNYYPMVTTLFWSFRIMSASGLAFIALSIIGLFGTTKKREFMVKNRFWMVVTGLFLWLPFVANTAGWLITEFGRQPWAVYGLIKVQDSVSPNVSQASLLTTNIVYFLIFAGLGGIMVYLAHNELKKGPFAETVKGDSKIDPFDKGAFGF